MRKNDSQSNCVRCSCSVYLLDQLGNKSHKLGPYTLCRFNLVLHVCVCVPTTNMTSHITKFLLHCPLFWLFLFACTANLHACVLECPCAPARTNRRLRRLQEELRVMDQSYKSSKASEEQVLHMNR